MKKRPPKLDIMSSTYTVTYVKLIDCKGCFDTYSQIIKIDPRYKDWKATLLHEIAEVIACLMFTIVDKGRKRSIVLNHNPLIHDDTFSAFIINLLDTLQRNKLIKWMT